MRFLRAALRYSEIGECTYRDRERSLTRDTDNRNPSDKEVGDGAESGCREPEGGLWREL